MGSMDPSQLNEKISQQDGMIKQLLEMTEILSVDYERLQKRLHESVPTATSQLEKNLREERIHNRDLSNQMLVAEKAVKRAENALIVWENNQTDVEDLHNKISYLEHELDKSCTLATDVATGKAKQNFKIQKSLENALHDNKALQQELSETSNTTQLLREELRCSGRTTLIHLEQMIANQQEKLNLSEEELQTLRQKISHKDETISELSSKISTLESLQSRNSAAQTSALVSELHEMKISKELDVANLTTSFAESEDSYKKIIQQLENQMNEKSDSLRDAEKDISLMELELESLRITFTKSEAAYQRTVKDLQNQLEDKSEYLETIHKTTTEEQSPRTEINSLKRQLSLSQEELNSSKSELNSSISTQKQLTNEITVLKNQQLEDKSQDQQEQLSTLQILTLKVQSSENDVIELKESLRESQSNEESLQQSLFDSEELISSLQSRLEVTEDISFLRKEKSFKNTEDLQKQLQDSENEIKILKQNVNDLKAALQDSIKEKHSDVNELENQIEDLKSELQSTIAAGGLDQQLQTVEGELEDRINEIEYLQKQLADTKSKLVNDVETRNQEIHILKKRLSNTSDDSLEQQLSDAKTHLQNAKNELEAALHGGALENEFHALEREFTLSISEKQELQNQLEKSEEQLKLMTETHQNERSKMIEEKDELLTEIKTLKLRKSDSQNVIDIEELYDELNDVRLQLEDKNSELEWKSREVTSVEKSLLDIQNEVNTLRGRESSNEICDKTNDIEINKIVSELSAGGSELQQILSSKDEEIINLKNSLETLKNEDNTVESSDMFNMVSTLIQDLKAGSATLQDLLSSKDKQIAGMKTLSRGVRNGSSFGGMTVEVGEGQSDTETNNIAIVEGLVSQLRSGNLELNEIISAKNEQIKMLCNSSESATGLPSDPDNALSMVSAFLSELKIGNMRLQKLLSTKDEQIAMLVVEQSDNATQQNVVSRLLVDLQNGNNQLRAILTEKDVQIQKLKQTQLHSHTIEVVPPPNFDSSLLADNFKFYLHGCESEREAAYAAVEASEDEIFNLKKELFSKTNELNDTLSDMQSERALLARERKATLELIESFSDGSVGSPLSPMIMKGFSFERSKSFKLKTPPSHPSSEPSTDVTFLESRCSALQQQLQESESTISSLQLKLTEMSNECPAVEFDSTDNLLQRFNTVTVQKSALENRCTQLEVNLKELNETITTQPITDDYTSPKPLLNETIDRLKKELSNVMAQKSALETRCSQLEEEVKQLNVAAESETDTRDEIPSEPPLDEITDSLRKDLSSVTAQKSALETRCSQLEEEVKQLNVTAESETDTRDEIPSEPPLDEITDSLRKDLSSVTAQKSALEIRCSQLEEEVKHLNEIISRTEQEGEGRCESATEPPLDETTDSLKKELSSVIAQKTALETRCSQLEEDVQDLNETIKSEQVAQELDETTDSLKKELSSVIAQKTALETRCSQLEEDVQELNETVKSEQEPAEYDLLSETTKSLKKELSSVVAHNSALETRCLQLEGDVKDLNETVRSEQDARDECTSESPLDDTTEELRKELSSVIAQKSALETRCSQLESDNRELNETIKSQEVDEQHVDPNLQHLHVVEGELQQSREAYELQRIKSAELENDVLASNTIIRNYESKLDVVTADFTQAKETIALLKHKEETESVSELLTQKSDLENRCLTLSSEVEKLKNDISELQNQLSPEASEVADLTSSNATMKNQLRETELMLATTQQDCETQKNKISEFEKEKSTGAQRLRTYSQKLEVMSSELSKARETIEVRDLQIERVSEKSTSDVIREKDTTIVRLHETISKLKEQVRGEQLKQAVPETELQENLLHAQRKLSVASQKLTVLETELHQADDTILIRDAQVAELTKKKNLKKSENVNQTKITEQRLSVLRSEISERDIQLAMQLSQIESLSDRNAELESDVILLKISISDISDSNQIAQLIAALETTRKRTGACPSETSDSPDCDELLSSLINKLESRLKMSESPLTRTSSDPTSVESDLGVQQIGEKTESSNFDLEGKLREATTQFGELQSRILILNDEKQTTIEKLSSSSKAIIDAEEKFQQITTQFTELQSKFSIVESEKRILTEKLSISSKQTEELQSQIDGLQENEIRDLRNQITELTSKQLDDQTKSKNIEDECDALRVQVEEGENRIIEIKSENENLKNQIESLAKELENCQEIERELRSEKPIDDVSKHIQLLKSENSDLRAQLETSVTKVADDKNEIEKLEDTISNLIDVAEDDGEKIETLERQLTLKSQQSCGMSSLLKLELTRIQETNEDASFCLFDSVQLQATIRSKDDKIADLEKTLSKIHPSSDLLGKGELHASIKLDISRQETYRANEVVKELQDTIEVKQCEADEMTNKITTLQDTISKIAHSTPGEEEPKIGLLIGSSSPNHLNVAVDPVNDHFRKRAASIKDAYSHLTLLEKFNAESPLSISPNRSPTAEDRVAALESLLQQKESELKVSRQSLSQARDDVDKLKGRATSVTAENSEFKRNLEVTGCENELLKHRIHELEKEVSDRREGGSHSPNSLSDGVCVVTLLWN